MCDHVRNRANKSRSAVSGTGLQIRDLQRAVCSTQTFSHAGCVPKCQQMYFPAAKLTLIKWMKAVFNCSRASRRLSCGISNTWVCWCLMVKWQLWKGPFVKLISARLFCYIKNHYINLPLEGKHTHAHALAHLYSGLVELLHELHKFFIFRCNALCWGCILFQFIQLLHLQFEVFLAIRRATMQWHTSNTYSHTFIQLLQRSP